MLVRVVAPHFVAGLVIEDGKCTHAAPILRWCVGYEVAYLRYRFRRAQWQASVLRDVIKPQPEQKN